MDTLFVKLLFILYNTLWVKLFYLIDLNFFPHGLL